MFDAFKVKFRPLIAKSPILIAPVTAAQAPPQNSFSQHVSFSIFCLFVCRQNVLHIHIDKRVIYVSFLIFSVIFPPLGILSFSVYFSSLQPLPYSSKA